MLMRYHWGLGIGHLYSHGKTTGNSTASTATSSSAQASNAEPTETEQVSVRQDHQSDSDVEDPELGFENREDDYLGEEDVVSEDELGVESDDSGLLAMDDMYGSEE
jgi:hypothetical protein